MSVKSRDIATIHVVSLNLHKGLDWRYSLALDRQRLLLQTLNPDILFLQEICGSHVRHRGITPHSHYHYLSDGGWPFAAYGKNVTRRRGHHGNAILSKYPIFRWDNQDISQTRFERRGVLHCQINLHGWDQPLHCICVHFGLLRQWRKHQLQQLIARVIMHVPAGAPLILAGDFNDWQLDSSSFLAEHGLTEVFSHAASYPVFFPLFSLDRIYVRGFEMVACEVHQKVAGMSFSDHAALSATLRRVDDDKRTSYSAA